MHNLTYAANGEVKGGYEGVEGRGWKRKGREGEKKEGRGKEGKG